MHSTAYQSVHMRRLSEKRRRKSSKEKADRAVALLGYSGELEASGRTGRTV